LPPRGKTRLRGSRAARQPVQEAHHRLDHVQPESAADGLARVHEERQHQRTLVQLESCQVPRHAVLEQGHLLGHNVVDGGASLVQHGHEHRAYLHIG